MFELNGKSAIAKVFTDNCEDAAISQIMNLINQEMSENQKIRIMPDVHAGAGCTIGTTMTITDKVVPNLVGVDIGCGMYVVNLGKQEIDFEKLDATIRKNIPSGFAIRSTGHDFASLVHLTELCCVESVNCDRAKKSIGTLGGGNHFIELDVDDKGNKYLVIHTGSRHLGVEVANFYQKAAYEDLRKRGKADKQVILNKLISDLKEHNRFSEIQSAIQEMKNVSFVPEDLAYCERYLFNSYIHDMKIVQNFADLNRKAIAAEILREIVTAEEYESFTTIHNYIDIDKMILRKGAVSAQAGEKLIIPMNMRDGSLICVGKGNQDWNCSAPHGAGRLMSRSKAKEMVSIDEFKKSMEGIYSTSVCQATIDESPMAYKPMNEIVANIGDTVEIERIIKPIYNFKASD